MEKEHLTDLRLGELIRMEKKVTNPHARQKTEGRHLRTDYRVVSRDSKHEFALYTRQSTRLRTSFSAGLRWLPRDSEGVMLMRCNGPSHEHTNALEGDKISFKCHVHVATERYLAGNKRDEAYAEATEEYEDLSGALLHLVKTCNISGLAVDEGLALSGLVQQS
jgi:hypothetical protein